MLCYITSADATRQRFLSVEYEIGRGGFRGCNRAYSQDPHFIRLEKWIYPGLI